MDEFTLIFFYFLFLSLWKWMIFFFMNTSTVCKLQLETFLSVNINSFSPNHSQIILKKNWESSFRNFFFPMYGFWLFCFHFVFWLIKCNIWLKFSLSGLSFVTAILKHFSFANMKKWYASSNYKSKINLN